MIPNTKQFIDGVAEHPNWHLLRDLLVSNGVSPSQYALKLALGLEKDVGAGHQKPFTRDEELSIAADLRAGAADQYIAGLLGYV